jgi:hypothetical protein
MKRFSLISVINSLSAIAALVLAAAAYFNANRPLSSSRDLSVISARISELEQTLSKLEPSRTPGTVSASAVKSASLPQKAPGPLSFESGEIRQLQEQITQITERQQRLEAAVAVSKKGRDSAFTSSAEAARVALDSESGFEQRIHALRALRAVDQVSADVASAMLSLAPKLLDPKSREEIYRQFEDFEDPLVVFTLMTALQQDADPKVRKKVGEILSSVQHLSEVRNALTTAVTHDPDLEVREKVGAAMLGIRNGKEKRP